MEQKPYWYLGLLASTIKEMVEHANKTQKPLPFADKFKDRPQTIKTICSLLGFPYDINVNNDLEKYRFFIDTNNSGKISEFLNGKRSLRLTHLKHFQQSDHYKILNDIKNRLEILFPSTTIAKTEVNNDKLLELKEIAPLFDDQENMKKNRITSHSLSNTSIKNNIENLEQLHETDLQDFFDAVNELSKVSAGNWKDFRKDYSKIIRNMDTSSKEEFKDDLKDKLKRIEEQQKTNSEKEEICQKEIKKNLELLTTVELNDEAVKQIKKFKIELCQKLLDDLYDPRESEYQNFYQKNEYKERSHFLDDRRKEILNQLFEKEEYDIILSYVFFYLATYVNNEVKYPSTYKQYRNVHSDDFFKKLYRDRYYDYYKKHTILHPNLEKGIFLIKTKIIFSSPYINPIREIRNQWTFSESFLTEELRKTFNITSLKINGTNYTENIRIKLREEDGNTGIKYKKEFKADVIEKSKHYEIELTYECERPIPYYQTPSYWTSPYFSYELQVDIQGNDADKFDIDFHPFFSRNINYSKTIKSDAREPHISLKFSIDKAIEPPINYGHILTIKPDPRKALELYSISQLATALQEKIKQYTEQSKD